LGKKGDKMAKKKEMTEKSEINRLNKIYKSLPKNQFAVVQGLIVEAARLRIRLEELWKDIQENGETEPFCQGKDAVPYERERPASRTYTATNKSYQAIIKQLNDLCPPDQAKNELDEFIKAANE
jgi:hypothetical protein